MKRKLRQRLYYKIYKLKRITKIMSNQIEEIKSKFDLKLIVIIILCILCAGMFIFSFNGYSNFKKDKKALETKIELFKHIEDSLIKESNNKIAEYTILENKFKQDSFTLDSLKYEFYDATYNARQSDRNSNYYRGKYSDTENKVIYLESHMINIKGDSLLISLSKKIN